MWFDTTKVYMTRGINETLQDDLEFAEFLQTCMRKYALGDWGDTCTEDWEMNDNAVKNGDDRVLALYKSKHGKIFIITEYDRSATTILFADEY